MTPLSDHAPNAKVLFVDDDPKVLDALLVELSRSAFDLFLARDAREGFDILENENVDLVVSDAVMPETDGLSFLKDVKERYPSVHRVLLSEEDPKTEATAAIVRGYATAHLTKPWAEGVLKTQVEQILKVRASLKQERLLEAISEIEKLPTLPALYREFTEAVLNDRPAKEIAVILEKDVSLSARLLQVANSAFFGMCSIYAVDQALVRLGLSAVKDMVLTFSFIQDMSWTQDQMNLLQTIFDHSALVNRYLKKIHQIRKGEPLKQEGACLGITHDIGKIIILQYFPERFASILEHQRENPGFRFYDSENALGFTWYRHEDVGAYFLNMWNLPDLVVEATLFHHRPDQAGEANREVIASLAATNDMISRIELMAADEGFTDLLEHFIVEEKLQHVAAEIGEEIRTRHAPRS